MKNFNELIQQCEQDLRAGQAQKIHLLFKTINLSKIPREFQLALANIARRTGLFLAGLKILNGTVRTLADATSAELAEYAVLLQKIGAVEEASELLNHVNKDTAPVGHLYQAFQCFHEWNGAGAVPHLEKFLSSDLSDYDRAVGRINLAAALLQSDQGERAESLLNEDIEANHAKGYTRLECNGYELLTQALLQRADFKSARLMIERAHILLAREESPDIQFVNKWQAIIEAHERQSIEPLQKLRSEAFERQDWEVVRDADLFICKMRFSTELFHKLYFGTPYEFYRKRIITTLDVNVPDLSRPYGYANASRKPEPLFDLAKGELIKNGVAEAVVEPGSKIHQVLTSLLMDLYRPLRVAGIFAYIFPEEIFNPFDSPDRIHRLIARTRKTFKELDVPLEIVNHHDAYSVHLNGGVGIQLMGNRQLTERNGVLLRQLEGQFGVAGFTPREAIKFLDVSPSTFKRLVSWGIKAKKIEKIGAGSAVVYRLINNSSHESSGDMR